MVLENSPSDHETWSIRCLVGIHVDFIHLAFTYSFGPSTIVWRELGPAPPFPPMRVLKVEWTWALSLVCEVAISYAKVVIASSSQSLIEEHAANGVHPSWIWLSWQLCSEEEENKVVQWIGVQIQWMYFIPLPQVAWGWQEGFIKWLLPPPPKLAHFLVGYATTQDYSKMVGKSKSSPSPLFS